MTLAISIFLILLKISFATVSIGLVGNLLSFLVYSRKAFKKNSINIYCRALAIVDSLIIAINNNYNETCMYSMAKNVFDAIRKHALHA